MVSSLAKSPNQGESTMQNSQTPLADTSISISPSTDKSMSTKVHKHLTKINK